MSEPTTISPTLISSSPPAPSVPVVAVESIFTDKPIGGMRLQQSGLPFYIATGQGYSGRDPLVAAWGAGVDSTAMLVEMIERGEKPDLVLLADTGAERPETILFVPIFAKYLASRGVRLVIVRNQPKRYKLGQAHYDNIVEANLNNHTLPGLAFGRKTCSQRWKITPQDKFLKGWMPAVECWECKGRITKLIGYDCSPADVKRYAVAEGYDDQNYTLRFPLRELGWTREDCIARIKLAGLPVPVKSACFFCPASKPPELHTLPVNQLRTIVLMEAMAEPRLRGVEGLWRTTVKGTRGGTPRPGKMTTYIRDQGLLPTGEIDRIFNLHRPDMIRWQEAFASGHHTQTMKDWLAHFERASAETEAEITHAEDDQPSGWEDRDAHFSGLELVSL